MADDERVPFEVAGRVVYVTPEMRDRLLSPDGWGDLSVEELAEVGILPGMSEPGVKPPEADFRPHDE